MNRVEPSANPQNGTFKLLHGLWVWGAIAPLLPDIGLDRDRVDSSNFVDGYQALAESLAAERPGSMAVQIRLNASGATLGRLGVVTPAIIGRADTREGALRLLQLTRATLPTELGLNVVRSEVELLALMNHVDLNSSQRSAVLEVRRRVEEASDYAPDALDHFRQMPAVLRWQPEPFGLRHASAVLAQHPTRATVILHLEPARPSPELVNFLDTEISALVDGSTNNVNPIRAQIVSVYRRRIRDLPRAALHIRVAIAAEGTVSSGLAHAVGVELTEQESFNVIKPHNDESFRLAAEIVEQATARWWGTTDEVLIDELLRLGDTVEAAGVVRLPSPARGGTPGLPSAPITTLPRSAQGPWDRRMETEPDGSVRLGSALGGGDVTLSRRELNQHLLVAGLPGFGKTITVQSLLYRLWANEDPVPFLVLDPAKSDYAHLATALGDDAVMIQLSPERIGFNPFGVPKGCSAHSHAGRVLAAFDAALRLSAHWPPGYITLARALYRVYDRVGTDGTPNLSLLRNELERVIKETGFAGSDGANVRAGLLGRIDFLANGPLGKALTGDEDHVIDYKALLSRPTIVQMRSFTGPTERSLVFALLLAGIISYRESHPVSAGLGHVTVLEEAHRILAGGDESTSEGVRLLVEAIAEQRGSGEGYVIVDQAPSLLHPGVLKLSGSVLTHRIVDPAERVTVGSAVLLDDRQQSDLARLPMGQAVLHSAERSFSVVVDVDAVDALMPSGHDSPDVSAATSGAPNLPFLPCAAGARPSRDLAFEDVKQKMEEAFKEGNREPAVLDLGVAEALKISNSPDEALTLYKQTRRWLNQLRAGQAKPPMRVQALQKGGTHE